MKIGEMKLNADDPIKYIRYTNGHNKPKHLQGIIAHATDTIITVNLGKYRDSFSLQDLACGVVEIPGLPKITLTSKKPLKPNPIEEPKPKKEVETQMREKVLKATPPPDELKCIFEDGGQKVNPVAKHYQADWKTAKEWLIEAGLMIESNTEKPPKKDAEPPTVTVKDADPIPYIVCRLPNGNIDWDVMWPIVKTELDKGRDKYEIAAELKIGKDAMKDKVSRMLNKANGKPTAKTESPSPPSLSSHVEE